MIHDAVRNVAYFEFRLRGPLCQLDFRETDDLIANRNIIRDLQLDMIFIKSIRLIFFSLSVAIDAFADCSW